MPRYYFHVQDGADFPDLQGTVLDNIEAAKLEAIRFSGDLLSNADDFWKGAEWSMRVVDAQGTTVLTLSFSANAHSDGNAPMRQDDSL